MRIALALLLVGCVGPTSSDGDDTPGGGSGTPIAASGAYQVHSDIDLTIEAVLPEPAEDVVVTLRDFSTNPAQTVFDLAEDLGVPAVAEIRTALPSYVEDKLEGWINSEINKVTVGGVPVPQVSGSIAALAETALTHFALDSELTIDGTHATHTLTAIDLAPAGLDVRVELDALPGEIVAATTSCSAAKGALVLGDHTYALAYGEYMWRAINEAVTAEYGTDMHGVISDAVNCPAIAHTVASKCYLGVCVGHEAQLTAICNAGVNEVVERMHDKLAEMRFDAIHFAAGSAKLVDADHDGSAEALAMGVWTAEINAGLGLRHVPATFSASR